MKKLRVGVIGIGDISNVYLNNLKKYDAVEVVACASRGLEKAQRKAAEHGIPLISSMGTGNKLDPSLLEISDISKTAVCPLARVMRRELRQRGITRLFQHRTAGQNRNENPGVDLLRPLGRRTYDRRVYSQKDHRKIRRGA